MMIKKFESYRDRSLNEIIRSIELSTKWTFVEDPKKEYGIADAESGMIEDEEYIRTLGKGKLYKHSLDRDHDVLFIGKIRDNGEIYTILWMYDRVDDTIYYLDDPYIRHSYGRLYEYDPSIWCIKVGFDFLNYLKWKEDMPTESEIEECFQDEVDDGIQIIDIMYGRGRDPKDFWEIRDYFSINNYGDEKKICIEIKNVDFVTNNESLLPSCQRLSQLYNVRAKVLRFDNAAIVIVT